MSRPRPQKPKHWATASCFALLISAGIGGAAHAMPFEKHPFRFTAVVEFAKPPQPWLAFCKKNPADCDADPSSLHEVDATDENMALIKNINLLVNKNVKAKTDKKHWGVADKWSYPDDGYGDCEDYALLKRKLLIEAGIPARALLMAVVWSKDVGHAVLLARTSKGEYVLDNLTNKFVLWSETPYKFVKRQSPRDLQKWVYVDGDPRKPNVELVAWENEPVVPEKKERDLLVAAAAMSDLPTATNATQEAEAVCVASPAEEAKLESDNEGITGSVPAGRAP